MESGGILDDGLKSRAPSWLGVILATVTVLLYMLLHEHVSGRPDATSGEDAETLVEAIH